MQLHKAVETLYPNAFAKVRWGVLDVWEVD